MGKRCLLLLLAAVLLTGCAAPRPGQSVTVGKNQPVTTPQTQPVTQPEAVNENRKGMWLSQFDLFPVYTENGVQRSREEFSALTATILDNIAAEGCNTVFLQVRPNGDSMYPSGVYPMSRFVTGKYGLVAEYDPVQILVSQAKERDLQIHAWINPLRCMKETELPLVPERYAIRQWAEDPQTRGKYMVLHSGTWYLNPAYPEVRELICRGAAEVLEKYAFDGLHMDDYFYPTQDSAFDLEAYTAQGQGMSLGEFRRNALNQLVAALYQTAHSTGVEFGISPAGMLDQVYHNQYADVYTWCSQPGYLDYICPQAYFGLEHQNYDFVSVCQSYDAIITREDIALYIGMSLGKALSREDTWAGTGKYEWRDRQDILKRCLETTAQLRHCRGVVIFCYQYYYDPVTGVPVEGTEHERQSFMPAFREFTWTE